MGVFTLTFRFFWLKMFSLIASFILSGKRSSMLVKPNDWERLMNLLLGRVFQSFGSRTKQILSQVAMYLALVGGGTCSKASDDAQLLFTQERSQPAPSIAPCPVAESPPAFRNRNVLGGCNNKKTDGKDCQNNPVRSVSIIIISGFLALLRAEWRFEPGTFWIMMLLIKTKWKLWFGSFPILAGRSLLCSASLGPSARAAALILNFSDTHRVHFSVWTHSLSNEAIRLLPTTTSKISLQRWGRRNFLLIR